MKIRLKNFRCYENKEYNLGKEGLTLLTAPSGSGKSTILLAINFALYGSGLKVVTYGKRTCKVELELDSMTITRTKCPNRLVVKKNDIEYEDISAQNIINLMFGKAFEITGYIPQNNVNSFVLMSPTEKLHFIEKICFKDANIIDIKKRSKNLLKQRHENLISVSSKLELATKMLKETDKPKIVKFPLGRSKNKGKSIKNEKIRLKNTEILINRNRKNLTKFENNLCALKILTTQLNSWKEYLNNNQTKVKELCDEQKELEYKGVEYLETLQSKLRLLIEQQQFISQEEKLAEDVERLNEMKQIENEEKEEEIKKIQNVLWKETSREECVETIEFYENLVKDLNNLSMIRKQMKKLQINENIYETEKKTLVILKEELIKNQEEIEIISLQKNVYKCPTCKNSVCISNGHLETFKNVKRVDPKKEKSLNMKIESLKKQIRKAEKIIISIENDQEQYTEYKKDEDKIINSYDEIPKLKEAREQLDAYRNYVRSQEELEKRFKDISLKSFSTSLVNFSKSIEDRKKILKTKKSCMKNLVNISEEKLRNEIETEILNKQKHENLDKQISELENNIENYEEKIDNSITDYEEKFDKRIDQETLKENIKKCENEYNSLLEKLEIHKENMIKIEQYEKYVEEKEKYDNLKNQVSELGKQEIHTKKLYKASLEMKELILKAEAVAVSNIITSINSHVQVYLDAFFTMSPIIVSLLPYKKTKTKNKPQIHTEVLYKGMEMDLKMLSGGELSRVVLAFALALGEIVNTPLMMLDESTASLDQEITNTVFDTVRENFSKKLVLVVAHQITQGSFDKIIKVES